MCYISLNKKLFEIDEIAENVRMFQMFGNNLQFPTQKLKERIVRESERRRSEKVLLLDGEAGRTRSQSRTRLKDLDDPEWKPVTAKSCLSSTAAVAPLADDHVTTFLVTVPHVKRKSSSARVKIETTMRSDAGSTAPTGSERVKLTSAIPTCETCLMIDTHVRAEASVQEDLIKPHRRTQRWQQRNS